MNPLPPRPRRPTVGRISTQAPLGAALESPVAVTVRPPAAAAALTAHRVYTHSGNVPLTYTVSVSHRKRYSIQHHSCTRIADFIKLII